MNLISEMNEFYYHMSLYELQVMNEGDYYDGLSYNSLLYLNVISQMEECTVSNIAKTLKITKPAVTLKINELAKLGAVVKIQSDTDRRVFYVKLSPHMENVITIYTEVFKKIEIELNKKYTKEQLNLFQDILHTITCYEWRNIKNE